MSGNRRQLASEPGENGFDQRDLRDAMGCFPTGVTVVTGIGLDGAPLGVTANSFSTVSLEPPLVLWSLNRRAFSLKAYLATDHFAVNILREGQEALSQRFARPLADKWAGLEYEVWETGCPIFSHSCANFECRVRHTYMGGDHVIFVGEVLRYRHEPGARPLLFYGGRYHRLDERG